MTEITENGIIYSFVNNKWIVGTNSSEHSGNAVPPNQNAPSHLVIPKTIEGHKITEIGAYAFRDHSEIVSVQINAEITQINHHAFSRCFNLYFINIPATVLYLFRHSLTCGISPTDISSISSIIIFESPSKLTFVESYTFANTKQYIIYFCGKTSPKFTEPCFDGVQGVTIYSQNEMVFLGKPTTEVPKLCSYFQSYHITYISKRFSFPYLLMFIFIF